MVTTLLLAAMSSSGRDEVTEYVHRYVQNLFFVFKVQLCIFKTLLEEAMKHMNAFNVYDHVDIIVYIYVSSMFTNMIKNMFLYTRQYTLELFRLDRS